MTNFNKLTPAETERLAILMEECAEVQQVIGKILRHGYDSVKPSTDETNQQVLERELGDLLVAYGLIADSGDIDVESVQNQIYIKTKQHKEKKYTHHQ